MCPAYWKVSNAQVQFNGSKDKWSLNLGGLGLDLARTALSLFEVLNLVSFEACASELLRTDLRTDLRTETYALKLTH